MPSPFHRGDYKRVRRSVTIALLELESLEPRMQVAYKRGLIPADAAANLSLARLMVLELDQLLRLSLDVAISDHWQVYTDATYRPRDLVA
jgi:hypothetical protein